MRRGEEHLDLSKKRGRGMRIMQNCLNLASHRVVADEEQSHVTEGDTTEAIVTSRSTAAGAGGASSGPDAAPNSARVRASRASLPKITSALKSARTPRRSSKVGATGAAATHGGKDAGAVTSAAAPAPVADQRKVEKEEES